MPKEELKKDLEKPSQSPVANWQREQSEYLYHIALCLDEIANLLKSQYGEQADQGQAFYWPSKENSTD